MFYSTQILARKGPLGIVWIAAHMDRQLKRNQVYEASIIGTVDALLNPEAPLALRLSGQLLLGVVRIYSRKVAYLHQDCQDALLKIRMAFKPVAVELNRHAAAAPRAAITLPDALDDLELYGGGNLAMVALQPLVTLDPLVLRSAATSQQRTSQAESHSNSMFAVMFEDEMFEHPDADIPFDLDEIEMERLRAAPAPAASGQQAGDLLANLMGIAATPAKALASAARATSVQSPVSGQASRQRPGTGLRSSLGMGLEAEPAGRLAGTPQTRAALTPGAIRPEDLLPLAADLDNMLPEFDLELARSPGTEDVAAAAEQVEEQQEQPGAMPMDVEAPGPAEPAAAVSPATAAAAEEAPANVGAAEAGGAAAEQPAAEPAAAQPPARQRAARQQRAAAARVNVTVDAQNMLNAAAVRALISNRGALIVSGGGARSSRKRPRAEPNPVQQAMQGMLAGPAMQLDLVSELSALYNAASGAMLAQQALARGAAGYMPEPAGAGQAAPASPAGARPAAAATEQEGAAEQPAGIETPRTRARTAEAAAAAAAAAEAEPGAEQLELAAGPYDFLELEPPPAPDLDLGQENEAAGEAPATVERAAAQGGAVAGVTPSTGPPSLPGPGLPSPFATKAAPLRPLLTHLGAPAPQLPQEAGSPSEQPAASGKENVPPRPADKGPEAVGGPRQRSGSMPLGEEVLLQEEEGWLSSEGSSGRSGSSSALLDPDRLAAATKAALKEIGNAALGLLPQRMQVYEVLTPSKRQRQAPEGAPQPALTQQAVAQLVQAQLSLEQLTQGKSRLGASRLFFEMLVLKTRGLLELQQPAPFSDISVQLTGEGVTAATTAMQQPVAA